MKRVGFVGWRGMVGSVLMERMQAEGDFDQGFEPVFFSTSQAGETGPDSEKLKAADSIKELKQLDIIVTCQGGVYTSEVYGRLRQSGWSGYWIDAASTLRLENHTVIVLDPVNRMVIDQALAGRLKDYIGGNCTVSLMLMALAGLFHQDLVEWVSAMTYQAASGAGAKNMIELIQQMAGLVKATENLLVNPAATALQLDSVITAKLRDGSLPMENFAAPLAASLLPWIDKAMPNGQSREEWKGFVEANKILQADPPIPIDGICVRVSSMRCHSQGLTIKLKKDVPIAEVEEMIGSAHEWTSVVPNEKDITLQRLTPAAVSGTLQVPVGRLRQMNLGPNYLAAFTVGDQLLWGAAEPLRRILKIILEYLD